MSLGTAYHWIQKHAGLLPSSRPRPSLSFYPVKKGILTETYFLDKETQKCILVITGFI